MTFQELVRLQRLAAALLADKGEIKPALALMRKVNELGRAVSTVDSRKIIPGTLLNSTKNLIGKR